MLLYIALLVYVLFAALLIYMVGSNATLSYYKQRKLMNALYLVSAMLPLTILSALRAFNIGNDTDTYISLYQNIGRLNILENKRYEHGYLIYNRILNNISTHPQFLLIVTALIVSFIIGIWLFKFSELPWLSVYLFITMGYFSLSMSAFRQFIAMLIVICASHYVLKRRLKQFVLLVLLAFYFHRTAIIFALAYPLSFLPCSKKTICIMLGGTIFCYLSFGGILSILFKIFPNYSYYIGGNYMSGGIRLASILNAMIAATVLIVGVTIHTLTQNRTKERLTELVPLIKETGYMGGKTAESVGLYVLAGLCITILSFPFNLIARSGDYFSIFALIYLPNALRRVPSKGLRAILTATVVLLFGLYFCVVQVVRPEWNHIYPYQFFWNT